MIHVFKPRLSERLLASIFQGGIIPGNIISLVYFENQYPLMHDSAIRSEIRNGGNQ
jgi:hypothetical protein